MEIHSVTGEISLIVNASVNHKKSNAGDEMICFCSNDTNPHSVMLKIMSLLCKKLMDQKLT